MYGSWLVLLQVCLLWVFAAVGAKRMVSLNVFRDCCPEIPIVIPDKTFIDCLPKKDEAAAKNDTARIRPAPRVSASCIMECAYTAEGLTTKNATNGKVSININAVSTVLDKYAVGDWTSIINSSKEACVTIPRPPKKGETCGSGANDVTMCLSAYFVNKCPTPNTTEKCMKRLGKMKKIIIHTGLNVNKSTTAVLARSEAAAAAAANLTAASSNVTVTIAATVNTTLAVTDPNTTATTVATTTTTVAPTTTTVSTTTTTIPTTTTTVSTTTTTVPTTTTTVPTTTTTLATTTPTTIPPDASFTTNNPLPVVIPSTYVYIPGIGYVRHSTTPKSFQDAKADCTKDRAYLYAVSSPEKRDYLVAFYNSSNTASFVGATNDVCIWTGVERYYYGWATNKGTYIYYIPAFVWAAGRPLTTGTSCVAYCKSYVAHWDSEHCAISSTALYLPYMCEI